MNKITVNILRAFVNENGQFGNPVGIVVDENQNLNPINRQTFAATLNFSESVFINDSTTGNVSIFNPIREVKFAGHALVGTSFFINKILGKKVDFLECKAGRVQTWQENGLTWIHAELANTPPWHYQQLPDVSSIENLSIKPKEHTIVWAWLDKTKGIVRARTFAPDWGIPEDEANGSGSMQLAAMLGQKLEIHHGKGSIIYARPAGTKAADVGGRVGENIPRAVTLE